MTTLPESAVLVLAAVVTGHYIRRWLTDKLAAFYERRETGLWPDEVRVKER